MNDTDYISAEAWNSPWGLFRHGLIKEPDFQPIPFPRYVRLAYGSIFTEPTFDEVA